MLDFNPFLLYTPRSVLLMMLTVCAGGIFLLENPCNSLISLYERHVWFVKLLASFDIPDTWIEDYVSHTPLIAINEFDIGFLGKQSCSMKSLEKQPFPTHYKI